MNEEKITATNSGAEAGDAARRVASPVASGRASVERATRDGATRDDASRRVATTRRTVGVYERPRARGLRLSLPLVVILILAALVSVVAAARFLF